MSKASRAHDDVVTIRPAALGDAEGIARTLLESAEHHAGLDGERYWVPPADTLLTRYRDRLRCPDARVLEVMLVAADGGEIVGFVEGEYPA
jgi:hypothetical protein